MKYRTFGIVAHVDAGKTTLTEALLYLTGQIRSAGRVDRGDTHLDTDEIEKERGITIFSKQARIRQDGLEMILLDTPGHADFSSEMERVLMVLDVAVLVVSGTSGVQSHTRTLWRLLAHYGIPVLIFVNKMDLPGADRERVLADLRTALAAECVDFDAPEDARNEEIAMTDDSLLDLWTDTGSIPDEAVRRAVSKRRLFPVWFGSALKMENLDGLIYGLRWFTAEKPASVTGEYGYGARVYKIGRDASGTRLTYLRVTKGTLGSRMPVQYRAADGSLHEEKIDQIRLYLGDQFEQVNEAEAGQVCAVTGLTGTMPGCGIGGETSQEMPVIEPVIRRRLILPPDVNAAAFMKSLAALSEEEPQLHIVWNEKHRCIELQLMGEVQIEVILRIIRERFGVSAECGEGSIIYKETVTKAAEGIGHFEPLRHYAEVHLLISPGGHGSGVSVASSVSEDDLDLHWQRLILTHLLEKEHTGVLTGSGLTDVKITLIAGRAHLKHTEGGDFRQAVYRAVRQGLMSASCALLEPYYSFVLEVPEASLGKAMTDLTRMSAQYTGPSYSQDGAKAKLEGIIPVSEAGSYQTEVSAYTRGEGQLSLSLLGYRPCHNPEEVIEKTGYDPEADTDNPSSSVFCAHGAGFIVPWDQVPSYAHLPCLTGGSREEEDAETDGFDASFKAAKRREAKGGAIAGTEADAEFMSVYEREFGKTQGGARSQKPYKKAADSGKDTAFRQKYGKNGEPIYPKKDNRPQHLIVDGYNIIFQWEDLSKLAAADISAARGKLLDLLPDYQGYLGYPVTVVFDAYRTKRNPESVSSYQNLKVVFTKENETADSYIERTVHDESGKYRFTVATSDGLEQLTVMRLGALRMPASELREDMKRMREQSGML